MFFIELKKARETAGLSQSKLASLLNVSQATVGMWETGRREPSFEMLAAISKHLGVPASQLLGETVSTEKKEAAAPECDSLRKEAMELYDSLPESSRDQALSYLRYLADRADKK